MAYLLVWVAASCVLAAHGAREVAAALQDTASDVGADQGRAEHWGLEAFGPGHEEHVVNLKIQAKQAEREAAKFWKENERHWAEAKRMLKSGYSSSARQYSDLILQKNSAALKILRTATHYHKLAAEVSSAALHSELNDKFARGFSVMDAGLVMELKGMAMAFKRQAAMLERECREHQNAAKERLKFNDREGAELWVRLINIKMALAQKATQTSARVEAMRTKMQRTQAQSTANKQLAAGLASLQKAKPTH